MDLEVTTVDADIPGLSSFTPEIIELILRQADDFGIVVSMYQINRVTRKLLQPISLRPNPERLFINDPMIYEFLPTQTKLLEYLSVKFKLEVYPPLTYVKLLRAYKHSALNPQCYNCISIEDALESAAKYGLTERLFPSISGVPTLYDIHQRQSEYLHRILAKDVPPGNFRQPTLLATIAYTNGQLEAGEVLYTHAQDFYSEDICMLTWDEMLIARMDAWSKFLLRPYKVKTSREILAEHSSKLFDPDVSYTEKREIWDSKYAPEAKAVKHADPLITLAVRAKLGILEATEITETNGRLLLPFMCQSGDTDLVSEIGLECEDYVAVVKALKRGYFEIINEAPFVLDPSDDFPIGSYDAPAYLLEYLDNYTLEQVTQLLEVLYKLEEDELTPPKLFENITSGSAVKLYAQFIAKYPVTIDMLIECRDWEPIFIHNDILDRMTKLSVIGVDRLTPEISVSWNLVSHIHTNDEYLPLRNVDRDSLVRIWRIYGRRQFEDSLIYLQDKIKLAGVRGPDLLLHTVIRERNLGLLCYVFGYKLGKFLPEKLTYELEPDESCRIRFPRSVLETYWKNYKDNLLCLTEAKLVILTLLNVTEVDTQ